MNNIPAQLFIDNRWSDTTDREPVINPANEAVIGEAPVGSAAQVDEAIAAARNAFDKGPWPNLGAPERVAVLGRMLDYFVERRGEIVDLIVREAGAIQMLAGPMQFDLPMKHARTLLQDALKIEPKLSPIELTPAMDGTKTMGTSVTTPIPRGVVSAITPYNYPFFLNLGKVMHALVMGNTCILKPSPFTPFQALVFGQAAEVAGLPAGVLNIVTGDIKAGEQLTTDKRVDMVTFTGSDKVGSAIMAQAAPTLKKLHLELGGKSALIVRQDANQAEALMAALMGFTIHCGQGCALTTRILVHNDIRKGFVEQLAAMANGVKIGDPADPSVQMGPLIREQARQRVESYVQIGLDEGGTLVAGGKRPDGFDKGFFHQATLFDNVDNRSRLAQEEVFGPIGVVIGFDSDDEAVAIANDSDYGLGGGIYSGDVGRAYEMALQIRTGTLSINGGSGTMLSSAPFGGIKRSGIGREYGVESLLEFTDARNISFHGG